MLFDNLYLQGSMGFGKQVQCVISGWGALSHLIAIMDDFLKTWMLSTRKCEDHLLFHISFKWGSGHNKFFIFSI